MVLSPKTSITVTTSNNNNNNNDNRNKNTNPFSYHCFFWHDTKVRKNVCNRKMIVFRCLWRKEKREREVVCECACVCVCVWKKETESAWMRRKCVRERENVCVYLYVCVEYVCMCMCEWKGVRWMVFPTLWIWDMLLCEYWRPILAGSFTVRVMKMNARRLCTIKGRSK
jgi:hypothetical protein